MASALLTRRLIPANNLCLLGELMLLLSSTPPSLGILRVNKRHFTLSLTPLCPREHSHHFAARLD